MEKTRGRVMPNFFFDFHEGQDARSDQEGLPFDSMKVACQEGLRSLCAMLHDARPSGSRSTTLVVRDEGGKWTRLTLTLAVETSAE